MRYCSNIGNRIILQFELQSIDMKCDMLSDLRQKKKLVGGYEEMDSPLQIQLIKFLGLKNYFVDTFIFKRKESKYKMCKRSNIPCILIPQEYEPPEQLELSLKLLETTSHSIPLFILTHKEPIDNYIIIYSHGNSSDLADSLIFMEKIALNYNVDVLGYDYSGYGESRVSLIDEQTIVKDLQIIVNWLQRPINKIILWGFSLGTYPTISVAAQFNVAAVVLIGPIASINCLFENQVNIKTKFKQDHFSNFDKIDKVKCKIFITHSIEDEIIPISHARLLFDKYANKNGKENIWFLQIAKLNHNGLHKYFASRSYNDLKEEFNSFLKIVRKVIKNQLDSSTRIKERYMIVQSELEKQDDFFEQDFELQAVTESNVITESNNTNFPGRKFTESNKRRLLPRCFD